MYERMIEIGANGIEKVFQSIVEKDNKYER